jgi:hypothetical protein
MLRWALITSYLLLFGAVANGQGTRVEHSSTSAGRPQHVPRELGSGDRGREVKYEQTSQQSNTRTARLRANLPVFELVYGQYTEYELGRALEESMVVRTRPLAVWPYDVRPDLSGFSWMAYDRQVI